VEDEDEDEARVSAGVKSCAAQGHAHAVTNNTMARRARKQRAIYTNR
jgi:hypothetical protein